jgi:hypothetical protein
MTTILNASITSAGTFYSQPFMSNDRSQRFWPQHNNIELVFTYGSGGTSVDVYLQVTHDGAIGHFAQMSPSNVRDIWRTSAGDSVLDPDQQVAAPALNWWRVRYVVAGTYVGTNLSINVIGADLVRPF